MKRRKLFSNTTENELSKEKLFSENSEHKSRRRLFSDENSNCNPTGECLDSVPDGAEEVRVTPTPEPKDEKAVKCMDCGETFKYDGSALKVICPTCGSDRFELVENITNPDELSQGDENPVDKVFSETRKRRKLYCNDTGAVGLSEPPLNPSDNVGPQAVNPSGSLTSSNPGPEKIGLEYTCPDCNCEFVSDEQYVDGVICPKCGGNRCRKKDSVNENFSPASKLEENAFSDYEADELDELLAKYKGKSINEDDLATELNSLGIYDEVGGVKGLVDAGYATVDGDQVCFSDISDFQRKMFSKLVISVTKEFDINPIDRKESPLDTLSERLPEKSIMILKRAHSINEPEAVNFSDKNYLRDSGISSDLAMEYGGTSIPLKEFVKLLNDEYPDAPDDIIDQLEKDKTIKVNGGKVSISK